MKFKANFLCKPGNFQMDDCRIEKVVELSRDEFYNLKIIPLQDHTFIAENKRYMFCDEEAIHCLLALGSDSHDGVLIESSGYDYPRYAAYVPGMRDIVNAEMDRAADYIIRHGIDRTESGNWCVYFEELEEQFGLTVRAGNGLDSMLRAALKRRPEVAAVDMHDGCIEMEYRPEYRQQLNSDSGRELSGLRLKDILPLLKGSGVTFLCHEDAEISVLAENLRLLTASGQQDYAALLNARVSEISPSPEGVEVVLTGVAPEELARFKEDCEAFQRAEQSMGPTMG